MQKLIRFLFSFVAAAVLALSFACGGPSRGSQQAKTAKTPEVTARGFVTVQLCPGEGLPEMLDRVGCSRTQLPVVMEDNGISLAAMPYLAAGTEIRVAVGCEVPVPRGSESIAASRKQAAASRLSRWLWRIGIAFTLLVLFAILLFLALVLGNREDDPEEEEEAKPKPPPPVPVIPASEAKAEEPVGEVRPAMEEPSNGETPISKDSAPPVAEPFPEEPIAPPLVFPLPVEPVAFHETPPQKAAGSIHVFRNGEDVEFKPWVSKEFGAQIVGCPFCSMTLSNTQSVCEKHLAEKHPLGLEGARA